jgi:hypothetical protein
MPSVRYWELAFSKTHAILPNRDVKGKPSERMGHKAIGPSPGAVTRTGSQLPYRDFLNLFFVPFTGSRFFNFKIGPINLDEGGPMKTKIGIENRSLASRTQHHLFSAFINRCMGRKPSDLLFRPHSRP